MAKKIKVEKERKQEVKENSNLGNISSWFFGVLFIFSGLVNLFTQTISGFLMLLIGIFLLPPIKDLIYKKTGFKFGFWKTIGIIIGIMFLSGLISGFLGIFDDSNNDKINIEKSVDSSSISDNLNTDTTSLNTQTNVEEKVETPKIKEEKETNIDSSKEIEEKSIVEEIKISLGEQNALIKAKTYLSTMAFSQEGLIQQLEFEGFTTKQAEYGVENCGADWYEQAAKKAKTYLNSMAFSKEGLIQQLEFEGFTTEQAEYGVKEVGY